MPQYTFHCDLCNSKFTVSLSMSEYDKKRNKIRCKECGSKKVNRDYEDDNITVSYIPGMSECTTIGQYADRQTKKYGREKCQKMIEGFKTKKEEPKPLPKGMRRIESAEDFVVHKRKRPPKK